LFIRNQPVRLAINGWNGTDVSLLDDPQSGVTPPELVAKAAKSGIDSQNAMTSSLTMFLI
jgi:hypothetical protein